MVIFKLSDLEKALKTKPRRLSKELPLEEYVRSRTLETYKDLCTEKLIKDVLEQVKKALAAPLDQRPPNVGRLEIHVIAPIPARVTSYSFSQEIIV